MKYSVKNNMNYTQDGCGGGYGVWKGIISLSSKSATILTAIMSNSASHFGGRNGFTGGWQILSLGGGAIAPDIDT
jgi:hypothetical protein